MTPATIEVETKPSLATRARGIWKRYRWFTMLVIVPTLIVAGYLYLVAADQYESEAHFIVRTQGGSAPTSGSAGIGAMLGLGGASGGPGAAEAMSIGDYLESHDVVQTLRQRLNLVAMFRRPEADLLSRLPDADPTPENLLKYYQKQVRVYYNETSGITDLSARAFRRDDAYRLATALLRLGEERINDFNARAYTDAVSLARRQLDESERAVANVQMQMTQFRQSERDVDPAGTAEAQIGLTSRLRQELSAAEAQLRTTISLIGSSSPQVEALRQQITSLRGQLAVQDGRLAGGATAIAAGLGNYERLKMQQEFLAKRYELASQTYEVARQNATRQQLYVVRVVEPNVPVKSTYPKRGVITLTVFGILIVVYAIGWLIVAGVKEHTV